MIYIANNDYKATFIGNIDITKCFPKKILYNETDSQPISFNPTMMFIVTDLLVTTPSYNTNPPLRVSWELDASYEAF